MGKKVKETVFCFLLIGIVFLISGCATEYSLVTKREDIILYPVDKEIQLGQRLSVELEKKFPVIEDIFCQRRIRRIGERLVSVCDRKDIDYVFKVIDFPGKNAISLPGGYVYISKELVDFCDNDDEIAAVLSHEIGHIVAKHGIKKLQASYLSMAMIIGAQAVGKSELAKGLSLAIDTLFSAYSQEDEFLADYLGAKYMKRAGYDIYAMIKLFSKLEELQRYQQRPTKLNYFRTHPFLSERIIRIKHKFIDEDTSSFLDYINRYNDL